MTTNKGSIKEDKFYSKALDEELELIIYYPPNYSPLYKYHILIAQDGRDYFNLGRIARTADELHLNRYMENTIIVGIPYRDVEDRIDKYHPKGEKNKAYIRFLAHELVRYLDELLPSYQMGMGRALIGDSLAGTVSLMTALSFPHTFGKVIMQSPYVNEDVIEKVKGFNNPHLLSIYQVIGKNETDVETTKGERKDFLQPNRELSQLLKEKQFDHFYEEFNGDHTWTYWQPDLEQALSKIMRS